MNEIKKVYIKVSDSGTILVSCQDSGVAILIEYPDGANAFFQTDQKNVLDGSSDGKNPVKRF